jgi:hypothetical protein
VRDLVTARDSGHCTPETKVPLAIQLLELHSGGSHGSRL